MEKFIVENCEAEGHIELFPDRSKIWDNIKTSLITDICRRLSEKFTSLMTTKSKSKDKEMIKLIEWTKFLTDLTKIETISQLALNHPDGQLHCCCLTQAMGKYAFIYMKRDIDEKTDTEHPEIAPQSESGLMILGSGCVGQMFRLYKRNRPKYKELLKPLATMILRNKQSGFIHVGQRSRDRGGLYVLRQEFLPALRRLDTCLREVFSRIATLKENIIKEATKQVKTHPRVHDAFMYNFPPELPEDKTRKVVETFIRKYTHARIGGFVRGGAERHAERKGQRYKGGGNLREKLTHVVGAKTKKGSQSTKTISSTKPTKSARKKIIK